MATVEGFLIGVGVGILGVLLFEIFFDMYRERKAEKKKEVTSPVLVHQGEDWSGKPDPDSRIEELRRTIERELTNERKRFDTAKVEYKGPIRMYAGNASTSGYDEHESGCPCWECALGREHGHTE